MRRVAICQPLVPIYRIPLFEALGSQQGLQLSVFAGGSSGSLQAISQGNNFNNIYAPVKSFRIAGIDLKYQSAQIKAVNPDLFDVVILPWDAHYLTILPCVIKSKVFGGPPVVLWGHGISKRNSAIRTWLRNVYGKVADAVILYNDEVAERLIREQGYEPGHCFVARNSLDQTPIQNARNEWLSLPERLIDFQRKNQLNPRRTLSFLSRLEQDNKVDMLIRGISILKTKYPDAKLIIIGDGGDRQRLECLAKELKVDTSVIFTGAIYDESRIAPWLLSSTVFCYPVNMGLSILHAFGYGLPVVTSDNKKGHGPEIEALVPGKNGLFYRDNSIESMVEKCCYFFDNPSIRDEYAKFANTHVTQYFTIEIMVKCFLDVISAFCKSKS